VVTLPTTPVSSALLLDAAGVDELLDGLAVLRGAMADAVPARLEPSARLNAIADPAWNTSRCDAPNGVTLALRHTGFGWLAFILPAHEARGMGSSLVQIASALGSPPT
jgi:hypothetical protein